MTIHVVPLGAGQDVGRSCVLVSMGGKNIMFDCGMHMGYNDNRKFPDFSYISKTGNFNTKLDCIIITHFHLDHCGALPYFTEVCGYDGPIFMTHPTKAISPILLEDYRKISYERKGDLIFTEKDLKNCMKKVRGVSLLETIKLEEDFEITPYYAGHVLGAAMFYVKVKNFSVVYTGDYNMTPDRHLGAAWIDTLKPDLLITESTYATTIRESKRTRERDFLKKVHDCISEGGKVIIPVFALGRAQELCILIETYWERLDLKIPVYFSAGLTQKANRFYQLFINWTNQKIKDTFVKRNMFEFNHIKPWDMKYVDNNGPCVLFSTPGMLHIGTSLEVFKKWAPNPKNMVILPGYCVSGTVGAKVLAGHKEIQVDKFTKINVNLQVKNLSFSAHADSKGIIELIKQCRPKNVMLVHGEKEKMNLLKSKIMSEFGIPCYNPANGHTVNIRTNNKGSSIPIKISEHLLQLTYKNFENFIKNDNEFESHKSYNKIPINGLLIMDEEENKFIDYSESHKYFPDLKLNSLKFNLTKNIDLPEFLSKNNINNQNINIDLFLIEFLFKLIDSNIKDIKPQLINNDDKCMLIINSIIIKYSNSTFNLHWNYIDENIANSILALLNLVF